MKLTTEQFNIVETNENLRINAGAGSGKTTTLIEYCRSKYPATTLYLAFNKSVKDHAISKFQENGLFNVKVETAHSLAYKHIVPQNNYKIRMNDYKVYEIYKILAMKEKGYTYASAKHVSDFFKKICNSSAMNFNNMEMSENERKLFDSVKDLVVQFYNKMNKGEIEVTHDFYLKKYQLSKPILDYQYILFDEGQDASPVMLDIFEKQQRSTKIIVGDENQQIYSWRYAINSLESVDYKSLYLTNSFRFNSEIARLANRILSWKNIINKPTSMKVKGLGSSEDESKRAILARTNIGLLSEAINIVNSNEDYKIYFEGNLTSYIYADEGTSLYDVLNLKNGKYEYIKDDLIKNMTSFDELKEYIEETNDVDLKMLTKIVDKYGNRIFTLLKKIKDLNVSDKEDADIVFSTVHKSKGMEYDYVILSEDFISLRNIFEAVEKKEDLDLMNEEINLLYVAITRAKNKIEVPEWLLPSDFEVSDKIITY